MKTRFHSRLADFLVSSISMALLAVVFTSCEDVSTLQISTPEEGAALTSLTDISGTYVDGAHGDVLVGLELTLQRNSDNAFWNGSTWGPASFNLPATFSSEVWQLAAGTALPSGPDESTGLRDDYYLITAVGNFQYSNDFVATHFFTVGVMSPPIIPKLYGWGYNSVYGSVGYGAGPDVNVPTPVDMRGVLEGKLVVAVATGADHSLALTSEGKVYSWGRNDKGQLGLGVGNTTDSPVPVEVRTSGELSGKKSSPLARGIITVWRSRPRGSLRLGRE